MEFDRIANNKTEMPVGGNSVSNHNTHLKGDAAMTKIKISKSSKKIKRKTLTQERLKEVLSYNPETGNFRWKINKGYMRPGDIAGYKNSGYIYIGIDGKRYIASRLAVLYMTGKFPEYSVEHFNWVKDDNRWGNLMNGQKLNARGANPSFSKWKASGIEGVGLNKTKGRWEALIAIDGEETSLGFFKLREEAAKARVDAEVEYGCFDHNHSTAYLYLKRLGIEPSVHKQSPIPPELCETTNLVLNLFQGAL